jgi:hypothetical protein
MRQADAPPAARIQAISILLDRGWGKPVQSHVGQDDGQIEVSIRQIIEHRDEDWSQASNAPMAASPPPRRQLLTINSD